MRASWRGTGSGDPVLHAVHLNFLPHLADQRNLVVRVHDAQDRVAVYMAVAAVDVLHHSDTLLLCLGRVRERWPESDVADALMFRNFGTSCRTGWPKVKRGTSVDIQ